MEDYYTIQTPGHHSTLFTELHVLQKQGVMCDVILAAEDGEVMAHKVVLMAASKYFRDKLSPVIGPTASKICLKGISVVELANLVKYIYTGKLLVAKETMDITLEISEILELNGVIQGYKEIISYEQMKENPMSNIKGEPISSFPAVTTPEASSRNYVAPSVPVNNTKQDQFNLTSIPTSVTGAAPPPAVSSASLVSSTSTVARPDSNQASKVIVTEQCEDGTTITYHVDSAGDVPDVNTSQSSSTDYNFDSLYDQQYMDVSAGSKTPAKYPPITSPHAITTPPKLQQMAPVPTDSQKIAQERAQHQDLLAVAIETLSDVPYLKHAPHQTHPEIDRAISSIPGNEAAMVVPQNTMTVKSDLDETSLEPFENGKTNTKTVTLSAGTVSNELGGKTDVYTVALDPSTVKSPLQMPKPRKRKTQKEKEAEEKAKKYRQKKAELLQSELNPEAINTTPMSDLGTRRGRRLKNSVFKQDFQYESLSKTKKKPFIPRVVLSPRKAGKQTNAESEPETDFYDEEQEVEEEPPKTGTGSKTVTVETKETEKIIEEKASADDFGQVVNFDSDDDEEDDVDGMIVNDIIAALKKNNGKNKSNANVKNDKAAATENSGNLKGIDTPKTKKVAGVKEGKLDMKSFNMEDKSKKDNKVKTKDIWKASDTDIVKKGVAVGEVNAKKGNIVSENENTEKVSAGKVDKSKELFENVTEEKEQLDYSQNLDEASSDKNRSSATKRKTRTPRRLPLSDEEKGNESGPDRIENVPVVRTRKSSRSLTLEKEHETYSVNAHKSLKLKQDAETKHEVKYKYDNDKKSNTSQALVINATNIDCKNKDLSQSTEIKIIAQSKVDGNALDEAESQILQCEPKKIIVVPKKFQPEIRLPKRTTAEMLEMAKGMVIRQEDLGDDEIGIEIETYETEDSDDVEDGGSDISKVIKNKDANKEKKVDGKRKTDDYENRPSLKKRKTMITEDKTKQSYEVDADKLADREKRNIFDIMSKKEKTSKKTRSPSKFAGKTHPSRAKTPDKNLDSRTDSSNKKKISAFIMKGSKSAGKEKTTGTEKPVKKGNASKRKASQKHDCDNTEDAGMEMPQETEAAMGDMEELGDSMSYVCPEDNCLFSSKNLSSLRRHKAMFHEYLKSADSHMMKQVRQKRELAKNNVEKTHTVKKTNSAVIKLEVTDESGKAVYTGMKPQLAAGTPNAVKTGTSKSVKASMTKSVNTSPTKSVNTSRTKSVNTVTANAQVETTTSVNTASPNTLNKARVACTVCGKTFKTARILQKHADTVHSDIKLKCDHCNFETSFKSSLDTHIMLKHVLKKGTYTCKFCCYESPLTGNLRKHLYGQHGLIVVTKHNIKQYSKFDEGTIITTDGEIFDPETMQLPKSPNVRNTEGGTKRKAVKVKEEVVDTTDEAIHVHKIKHRVELKQKPARIALCRLPVEEFLQEMMRRHQDYIKEPEKKFSFMSTSIARATEHPSFPQASPQVRNTRADKIYNMKKSKPTFQLQLPEQNSGTYGIGNVHGMYHGPGTLTGGGQGGVPQVASEVEVEQDYPTDVVLENVETDTPATVLTISEQKGEDGGEMIVINQNGKQTIVRSQDFYDTLSATGHNTSQTLSVISALLQAGEQIEIREQEELVEIQNV